MTEKRKIILIAVAIGTIAAAGTRVGTAIAAQNTGAQAQSSGATADSKQKEKKLVAGEGEAKRLLLLMDRDQNGKVSRQEFMSFMEEEFQLLDVNKDGELDVRELTQSRLVPHGGVHR
jgi:Ca2+-binding EF-hand superfamily protein